MSHKRLLIAGTIIAFIIIAGFILSVPHTRDLPVESAGKGEKQSVPEVTLRDVFKKKGGHTITGSIIVPNACTSVTADASIAGEGSESGILVALTLTDDAGVCLQVPTRATFSVTIAAPVDLPIFATVNGAAATTTEL